MKTLFSIALASLACLASGPLLLAQAAKAPATLPEKLDLPTALQHALGNNFAIRQARERIRQQEGVEIEVQAQRIPQVSLNANASGNSDAVSRYLGDRDRDWAISLQAKQTLYSGGGVEASVRNAKLIREAALLELQGIVNEQMLLVRTRFFNVLLYRERIGVQEQNVKLLEEQLRTARNRLEAGATSTFEVLRAEVALANGQPPLIQAKNGYRLATEELRQALGVATTTDAPGRTEFLGALEVGPQNILQVADALSTARANRPELRRIAKLAEAGEEGVKAARSGSRPSIQAFGRYDIARGAASSAWGNKSDGMTLGVQGQWTIFDGRSNAGKVMQARSRLVQTQLSLEETTLAIEVEVRRALSSYQEASELITSTSKVVTQAEEALRLANVRHEAGAATQLDVLTSQVALTEARLNQLSACHAYNVALSSLNKAIGKADSYSGG
jgi:outer membrane protein TolC